MRTTCKSQRFLVWLASQSPSETSCCLVGLRGLAELLGVGGSAFLVPCNLWDSVQKQLRASLVLLHSC